MSMHSINFLLLSISYLYISIKSSTTTFGIFSRCSSIQDRHIMIKDLILYLNVLKREWGIMNDVLPYHDIQFFKVGATNMWQICLAANSLFHWFSLKHFFSAKGSQIV